jgi:hypothetical protein
MKTSAGQIDAEKAKAFLGDGFDAYLGKEGPMSRSPAAAATSTPASKAAASPFRLPAPSTLRWWTQP